MSPKTAAHHQPDLFTPLTDQGVRGFLKPFGPYTRISRLLAEANIKAPPSAISRWATANAMPRYIYLTLLALEQNERKAQAEGSKVGAVDLIDEYTGRLMARLELPRGMDAKIVKRMQIR